MNENDNRSYSIRTERERVNVEIDGKFLFDRSLSKSDEKRKKPEDSFYFFSYIEREMKETNANVFKHLEYGVSSPEICYDNREMRIFFFWAEKTNWGQP